MVRVRVRVTPPAGAFFQTAFFHTRAAGAESSLTCKLGPSFAKEFSQHVKGTSGWYGNGMLCKGQGSGMQGSAAEATGTEVDFCRFAPD